MKFKTVAGGGKTIFLPFSSGQLSRQRLFSTFLFVFIVIVNCFSAVKCNKYENEFYSSVAGLERLLKTEQILMTDLKDYVATTTQQLALLEKEILKIEIEHELAAADTENYLTNPVNAYKLINRLFNGWDKYEEQIADAFTYIQQLHQRRNTLDFPSDDDFEESALALVRLQKTYNLEVSQLASGVLNGVKYGSDMSWSDCLMLGEQLIRLRAYNQTRPWMQESIKRLNFDSFNGNKISLEFMEILAENLLKTGDVNSALKVVQIILNEDPLRKGNVAKMFENTETLPEMGNIETEYHATQEFKTYEKVCREEIQQSPAEKRNLRCRYHTGNCAFCKLAPIKVEELHLDPLVMVFHDMISDEKIEKIKELAIPNMKRSTVRAESDASSRKRNYRISKNAWLPYNNHPYMEQMLRDLHDVTSLDMTYSEELQVANYGLGGHYEPHFDFFTDNIPEDQGNRISTSIFYLSDVEQGGATAFPFLKIAVKPAKGNVLFWYNLHRSSDGDFRTKHAGCPVLKGSKWIGNVWTHERRQEMIRPCGLVRDHESSLQYATVK
ncbi:prolyl 4-hydroxylase subunit alpha-2 [Calliphora vicina]|uniref:prolyl 4-hydroxylase subunit alpha-2 n=1 Tax=Calliphora vicina TaxID=7373 RepID=UPI00325BEEC0